MIHLQDVTKSYGENLVLSDVNMEIEKQDFVVIHGKSGSGKSTLLNILGGLEKPSTGSLSVAGETIDSAKERTRLRREKIGFIFQNYGLIDDKTVKDNFKILSSSRNKITEDDMVAALDRVDLGREFLNRKVYELSGGEQQRVSIARVILKKADIVLADEPTGNLDADNEQRVFTLLKELNEEGVTVICVSHSEEARKTFYREFTIDHGEIVENKQNA